jgi:dTDP-4-dehydrorhamnose reductase
MKILITGGTGLLGKALIDARGGDWKIIATYVGDYLPKNIPGVNYQKLDMRDAAGCAEFFADFQPEIVIHTASIGSPDFAEKNKEITRAINVDGTRLIAGLCAKYKARLIFISSNGIYDGAHAPYGEEDEAKPINYYGITKLEGEKIVNSAGIVSSIVRPILMYGWPNSYERGNIVTMALSRLKKGEAVNAYDDVYSNALYVEQCAAAIKQIIKLGKYETFNIAGAERTSIYGLLVKTATVFGFDPGLVKGVKQGFFNELVNRPVDTSYKTAKMAEVLKLRPLSLAEGLKMMKAAGNGHGE